MRKPLTADQEAQYAALLAQLRTYKNGRAILDAYEAGEDPFGVRSMNLAAFDRFVTLLERIRYREWEDEWMDGRVYCARRSGFEIQWAMRREQEARQREEAARQQNAQNLRHVTAALDRLFGLRRVRAKR